MNRAILLFALLTLLPYGSGAQTISLPQKAPVSRFLAERNGTKVTLVVHPDNSTMQVIRDYCSVTVLYSDETVWTLPTFRLTPSADSFIARIDPRTNENVALIVQGELLILSKDEKKSTRISILRNDLIESKPEIDAFRIVDVVWSDGKLVCLGMFREKEPRRRSNRFSVPFVSTMQVDTNGVPSSHQILWTTWHSKATPELIPDGWIHMAGRPVMNSLIAIDHAVLWRNEGHWRAKDGFPGPDHDYLEKSSWLITDLRSGLTERPEALEQLGLLDLTKQRSELITSRLRQSLLSPGNPENRRRLEHLISSFGQDSPRQIDPSSEQDGARQPATAPDSKSEGSEKPKPVSEGRSQ